MNPQQEMHPMHEQGLHESTRPGKLAGLIAISALSGAVLAGCAPHGEGTAKALDGQGVVAARLVDTAPTEQNLPDNWEVPSRPIENARDFIAATRGPVGDKETGHNIYHGDSGFTLLYEHPVLGEVYLSFYGDTSVQKATSPTDKNILIDDTHPIGFLRNNMLITNAATGGVNSAVKPDSAGNMSRKAFIEVPMSEKIPGHDTYFWPASAATDPETGDVYLALTKQINVNNQDPSNPGFGFESTGDNSLVILHPTADPQNPFEIAGFHTFPRVDSKDYFHSVAAMISFDKQGDLIIFDSVIKKNDKWAWGYDIGATKIPRGQLGNTAAYLRWTGQGFEPYSELEKDPMLGVGAVIPASIGMEGTGQITRDSKTGEYVLSFKQYSIIGDQVMTLRSNDLLRGWQQDPASIKIPAYKSTDTAHLTLKERETVEKLDKHVLTYLASSFQLKNGEWVNQVSFNYNGAAAGKYVETEDGRVFASPKQATVIANTGVAIAGKLPNLNLSKCLPASNETWPEWFKA